MSFANNQNPNGLPSFVPAPAAQVPHTQQAPSPYDLLGSEPIDDRARRLYEYPGVYDLQIVEVYDGRGSKTGRAFFGATFLIVSSDNKDVPAGSSIEWSTTERTNPMHRKYFAQDIQKFIGAVFGVDPNTVTQDTLAKVLDKSQPAQGRHVRAESYVTSKGQTRTRFAPLTAANGGTA